MIATGVMRSGGISVWRAVAPYWYQLLMAGLIPLAFWLDLQTTSVTQQNVLGVAAWLILIAVTRLSTPGERRQVWIMVGIATGVEIWSSIVWGIYRYRFGNVPLFVPPGHGLVYLFALRTVRTPFVLRHPRLVARAGLAGATTWALFGVTLEPLLLHRLDLMGMFWFPLFVWFMRKPTAAVYACAFFVTSYLELWGTHVGTWAWQVYAPISRIPTGNPPSVIAAGYALMDFWAISLAAMLPPAGLTMRWLRHRVPRGGSPLKRLRDQALVGETVEP